MRASGALGVAKSAHQNRLSATAAESCQRGRRSDDRTPHNSPACNPLPADFETGDVCKFYRTQRLGIGETCVFAETHSGSKYADNMMRRDGAQGPGMGTLIPGDWCPVWESTKAKRPE